MRLRISSIAGACYDYLQFVDQVVFGIKTEPTRKMRLGTEVDALIKAHIARKFDYPHSALNSKMESTPEARGIASHYLNSPLYDVMERTVNEILNMDDLVQYDLRGVPLTGHPDLVYRDYVGEVHVVDFKTSSKLRPGWSHRFVSEKMKDKEQTKTLVESNFGWAVQLHCYGVPYAATHHHIVALSSMAVTEYHWNHPSNMDKETVESFVMDLWDRVSPGGHLYPNLSPEESETLRSYKCSLHRK